MSFDDCDLEVKPWHASLLPTPCIALTPSNQHGLASAADVDVGCDHGGGQRQGGGHHQNEEPDDEDGDNNSCPRCGYRANLPFLESGSGMDRAATACFSSMSSSLSARSSCNNSNSNNSSSNSSSSNPSTFLVPSLSSSSSLSSYSTTLSHPFLYSASTSASSLTPIPTPTPTPALNTTTTPSSPNLERSQPLPTISTEGCDPSCSPAFTEAVALDRAYLCPSSLPLAWPSTPSSCSPSPVVTLQRQTTPPRSGPLYPPLTLTAPSSPRLSSSTPGSPPRTGPVFGTSLRPRERDEEEEEQQPQPVRRQKQEQRLISTDTDHMRNWSENSPANAKASASRPSSPISSSASSSSISLDTSRTRSLTHPHSQSCKHSSPPTSPGTSSPTSSPPSSPNGHSSKFSQLQAKFESNLPIGSSSTAAAPCPAYTQNHTRASTSMSSVACTPFATFTPLSAAPSRRNSCKKTNGPQHPLATVSTIDTDQEGVSSDTNSNPQDHDRIDPEDLASDSPQMSTDDMSLLKDAIKSVAPHVLSLRIKARAGEAETEQEADRRTESEWASLAVASGGDQPLSPVTASHPTGTGHSLARAIHDTQDTQDIQDNEVTREPEPTGAPPSQADTDDPSEEGTEERSTTPPTKTFEMWTPPPPGQRPPRHPEHQSAPLRQPQGRLQRILKHRSFNFPFSTTAASGSASGAGSRSSIDSSMLNRPNTPSPGPDASNQRPPPQQPQQRHIGPPDPIPPHYQHLQQRNSATFRRRSHAGELDRFSPGWIVAENAAQGGTPRASMSEERSTDATTRRHSAHAGRRVSLGVQAQVPSMWSRLFTSFFVGGIENHDEYDFVRRESVEADSVVQRRLLLTPLSLQQNVHPLYQQQLFFYADELEDGQTPLDLISRASSQDMTQGEEGLGERRRSVSADNAFQAGVLSASSSSVSIHPQFRSLANNANLQGELAQEDGRESLEMMSSGEPFLRPETPSSCLSGSGGSPAATTGDESEGTPKLPLSAVIHNNHKIPVSSLALSSPPSYWEAAIKYKGWPKIEPRPEQGQEALPRYTCSVFREGCINRKTELVGNWRPYRRPWKRTFAHLRGTALRLYAVDMDDVPRLHVRNISLQMARCEIAVDYKQRPNVIRIRACDRTLLMECKDRIDALTWLEHLQAAANIATSLEDRCMPKFYTLPRAMPPAFQHEPQPQPQQQPRQQQHQRHSTATPASPATTTRSGSRSSSSSGVSHHHGQTQRPSQNLLHPPQNSLHPLQHADRPRALSDGQPSAVSSSVTSRPNSMVIDPEMASRQLQLQYQLQEQQEQILQRQIREEMHTRTLQMLVRSSSAASRGEIVSPMLRRAQLAGGGGNMGSTAETTTPTPPTTTTLTIPTTPTTGGRRQSHSSLLTRAERERTMTEQERRMEEAAVGRNGDVTMRNVLRALGQSSSSESGGSTLGMDTDEEEEDRRRQERARQNRRGSSSAAHSGQLGQGWHHVHHTSSNSNALGIQFGEGAEGHHSAPSAGSGGGGQRRSSRQWSRVLGALWGGHHGHGHGDPQGGSEESRVGSGSMPSAATVSPTAS
ncbi:hypothetical protein EMPS_06642 [Entomortierella parvispora]|uniref:PH domain-containing protein n=1 Tax=Entomortierella parvispora TaxID=205924 RepID=A0A9P3HCP2_9FUNG|nr:hypothetical protein EMPS_06642 [Entomortierella parvispora]